MWVLFVNFLGRLKLKHFLIIGLIVSIAFSVWTLGEVKYQKSEKDRQSDNFNNLRDIDSLKVAHLSFKSTGELKNYIESKRELSEMVDEQNIKIRKLQNIVYQKQTYIDNRNRSSDVTNIVENINNDISSTAKWNDSTECLYIEGDVTYKDSLLKVNINKRKFDNTILITGSWRRNPRNLWTRIFGRKIAIAKATSKCGESETIIIDKKKDYD